MPKIKPRSSRRAPPPKESDFDHEIRLVDHSGPVPRTASPEDEVIRPSISESTAAGPSKSSASLQTGERRSLSDGAEPEVDPDEGNSQEELAIEPTGPHRPEDGESTR